MNGDYNISWVIGKMSVNLRKKWDLGVRGLRLVNLALLAKWRWILVTNTSGLSWEILFVKYSVSVVSSLMGGRNSSSRSTFLRWKELYLLRSKEADPSKYFVDSIFRIVNSGLKNYFWEDPWVEPLSIKKNIVGIYSICT